MGNFTRCDFHLSFKELQLSAQHTAQRLAHSPAPGIQSVPSTQPTVSKAPAVGDSAAPFLESQIPHRSTKWVLHGRDLMGLLR